MPQDKRASFDWLQYWIEKDNHFCAACWVKKFHKKDQKQLEHKTEETVEMAPWPYDDDNNPDNILGF